MAGISIGILYLILSSIEIGRTDFGYPYYNYFQDALQNIFDKFYYFDPVAFILCQGKCKDFGGIIYLITIPLSYGIIGLSAGLIYGKIKKRKDMATI